MIRIRMPNEVPEILRKEGIEQTRKDCEAYDRNPNKYRSGLMKFRFSAEIYGAADVKGALKKAQCDKCCYCESKFVSSSYGVVEHFRPKGGVKQNVKENLRRPGYYWLAYDWKNLLFSCEKCNTSHKRNLFPLLDDAKRAESHHHDITRERPLLINPAYEDPRAHLHFHGEVVIGDTDKGRQTIQTLGLMRKDLRNERHRHLSILKALQSGLEVCRKAAKLGMDVTSLNDEFKEAQKLVQCLSSREAKYSAMIRDFLKSAPL